MISHGFPDILIKVKAVRLPNEMKMVFYKIKKQIS